MRLIITGGFLGSGKTTAIVNGCRHLIRGNRRVGVITNDQGVQQVDTAFVKNFNIPVEEVANGCFCCKYDEFYERIQFLVKNTDPDFLFAEAVGSCTDLVATLAKPLAKHCPDLCCVICVFVDAALLISILEQKASFINESVRYIFRKQLEEADIIVVNKKDLLEASQVEFIQEVLPKEFPNKKVVLQNSTDDVEIPQWLDMLENFQPSISRTSLEIDYNIYGAGEAELSWCDEVVKIHSHFRNAGAITASIIGNIFDVLQQERLVIGHLKFLLQSGDAQQKISFTTTSTRSAVQVNLPESEEIVLLVNARVQCDPHGLLLIMRNAFVWAEQTFGCQVSFAQASVFRPVFPVPTHRLD